ncbi:MAG: hypothetical protein IT243_10075 [Bacteroidia bacterium]|nr:hypothetical protein [Bacteroidia bacterium]
MKNVIKNQCFFLLILLFTSCIVKPDEDVIKKSIKNYYSKKELADGAGSWDIKEIIIIEIIQIPKTKEWNVKSEVSGEYENFSLPDEYRNKHSFKDTISLIFYKQNGNNWQYKENK